MRVVLTGATGTIGSALARVLAGRGDQVVALSRDAVRASRVLGAGVEVHAWPDPTASPPPAAALGGADAVVNLIGEEVAQRWSASAKQRIHDSRVLSTRMLVEGLRALEADQRPRALVGGSAVGYYGDRGAQELDETSGPGDDFLARLVVEWEAQALALADLARVVLTRTGIVLSSRGGALAKMLPFFRAGVGGPVAAGRQYMPWIHLGDEVGALLHCLDDERASGPVNLVAPAPVTNAEFSRALGRALRRPAVLPVPGFALRALYGEMAEVVTGGQRVVPRRLRELGYEFRFAEIEPALRDALG